MQPSLFSAQQWTVSRLTAYLRNLIETDAVLQDATVTGEISNLSRPASGHVYFTLKDANSSLKCVMWKTGAARLRMVLQDGLAVEVHGRLGIYEVSGQYQLYVDQIKPVGEGALYQEFMRLKAVPDWVMSAVVNEATLTASENTTVKLIGKLAVGSAWPFAWLTVTVGAVFSYMTEPPALVLAALLFPA